MTHRLKPTVIDFFCGAGGFSEGFRQQGFDVLMGIDNWSPAIETHNLNHNLNDVVKDVLDFGSSIDEINNLPDTEIIVGSPPCVLFSLSNKGGKADKTLGIRLIESYLRVVAVKKHQPESKLVAWFMENVPNSKNYVSPTYTFRELNLAEWAQDHNLDPDQIALNGSVNGHILNTADFGVSQKRTRFVCGEIVSTGKFPDLHPFIAGEYRGIGLIKGKMPLPNMRVSQRIYTDPNYPSLKFRADRITDHFYDSGIYESQWKNAKNLKINHPYMGKMSFPEDEAKPSRTIMATRSMTTRESLIYKSEYKRHGDGEYRLPTIREIATLMGFPYSYQFSGGENTKWRQIGNAVCPPMSSALAKSVRLSMGLRIIPDTKITFNSLAGKIDKIENLNTFSEKRFDNPPKKKVAARFREHPFKEGNMTVALTNYDPAHPPTSSEIGAEWYSSVFIGSGKNFVLKVIPKNGFKKIAEFIKEHDENLENAFIRQFDKKFGKVIGKVGEFQDAYVGDIANAPHEPSRLINEIGEFITSYVPQYQYMEIPAFIPDRGRFPTKQVLAMYAINRIIS
jgi:DNA (cytosine-5)-methyltransferase 1